MTQLTINLHLLIKAMKISLTFSIGFVLLFIFFLIGCKKEATVIKTGDLSGIIKNEFGQPIESATVKFETSSTFTNVYGVYTFLKVPVNEYSVSVSKESFIPSVQKVNVIENKSARLDFTLKSGVPFFNISESELNATEGSGSFNIQVSSNAGWIIKNSSPWLQCSVPSGEGNMTVEIRYSKNQEIGNRTDTIEFTSGTINWLLIIHQPAQPKISKSEGRIGNSLTGAVDSVYLEFSRPVHITKITSNQSLCQCVMTYKDKTIYNDVTFSFSCAALGGKYPFTVQFTDVNGKSFSDIVDVTFYKSKLDLSGNITDFLLINDDKEILISTNGTNKITRYSIETGSTIKTYDLSGFFSPMKLAFNPYNSKFYLLGGRTDPNIYTFDLQNEKFVKAVTVNPDSQDHPQYPANIPYNIGFTSSGQGVVLLKSNETSAIRWKMINCTMNDSIYQYPYYDSSIDIFTLYDNVLMNYDRSKLYLVQPNSNIYGIFDGDTKRISSVVPTNQQGKIKIMNRKSDKYITGWGSADYSYRQNEDNIIYTFEGDYFRVMNYDIQYGLMKGDLFPEMATKIMTTLDGKYLISYRLNSDGTSSLFVFNVQEFYRYIK